jgi:hypothetical protein
MSATVDQELAELGSVYAQLRKERDATLAELQARTASLTQRDTEYGERIEYQAATINVLKAMSASPGDPQPAFDLIARRAQALCNGWSAGIAEFDGALIHLRAWHGPDPAAILPMRPSSRWL